MERDYFEPFFGINKELNMQFVFTYTAEEFAAMLYSIAEAKIETKPLITGKIGIDELPGAFNELRCPDTHAKIIVERWR